MLTEQFADKVRYVTAVLADPDTRTGKLSWINPNPYHRREVGVLVGSPGQ
ncbi:hypothetical protein [Streptomyces sp. ISL-100]|nr:hypothetical protein [Streptomyces sp. ISL-100]MBT2400173.1 hypothetical protein [Streptomyces sp. ISL-100]